MLVSRQKQIQLKTETHKAVKGYCQCREKMVGPCEATEYPKVVMQEAHEFSVHNVGVGADAKSRLKLASCCNKLKFYNISNS